MSKEISHLTSRRRFLQFGAVATTAVGASAVGLLSGCQPTSKQTNTNYSGSTAKTDSNQGADGDPSTKPAAPNDNPKHAGNDATNAKNCFADVKNEFYGDHQAGITTPAQRHIYFLVMDLHTDKLEEIKDVFKQWTQFSANLTQGQNIKPYDKNDFMPPTDTGEADSLSAYGLTLTFGISPSFLKKMGLTDKMPKEFSDLPLFPRDQIRPDLSGGDICIQACADDEQVTFHAIRQLVRQARSSITMRWSQAGFVSFDTGNETPRNLFGFKDGTANQDTMKEPDNYVWADSPDWLAGGTYMVARKIQMHLETWDRTSQKGQNETFGRQRESGAGIGQQHEFDAIDTNAKDSKGKPVIPENSHVGLSKTSGMHILRRSYSYASGIDSKTGQFDAGLLFISFQKSPAQFITLQSALGRMDRMNEYITTIGSGLFACFGGVKQGEYIGQKLFEG